MRAKKPSLIRSRADLERIHSKARRAMSLRTVDVSRKAKGTFDVMLCMGTSCISSGALDVKKVLVKEIRKRRLGRRVVHRYDPRPGGGHRHGLRRSARSRLGLYLHHSDGAGRDHRCHLLRRADDPLSHFDLRRPGRGGQLRDGRELPAPRPRAPGRHLLIDNHGHRRHSATRTGSVSTVPARTARRSANRSS